ncbi:hypothetical protein, partial [Acinetobacter baumannii]|uniref:hypothetical protein n=1 Tax=Acinetobacter baumannii TaxID=470 RepID=UPI003F689030
PAGTAVDAKGATAAAGAFDNPAIASRHTASGETPRKGALRFLRRYPTIALGGALLVVIVIGAVFAPWLGTVDPTAITTSQR